MRETKERLDALQNWFDTLPESAESKAYALALKITHQAELARQDQGLSYSALARLMGVSPAYVNRLMHGRENSTLLSLIKLGEALGLGLIVDFEPQAGEARNKAAAKAPALRKTRATSAQTSQPPVKPLPHRAR